MRALRAAAVLSLSSAACDGSDAIAAPSNVEPTRPAAHADGATFGGAVDVVESSHRCDEYVCGADEFCVQTQGAVCSPLPPAGQPCPEGCTLTPHCCNCPAFACLAAPEEHCPDGPSCGCLEAGFLVDCGPDRRECTETNVGTDILCIAVAYDEDPFAE